MQIIKITDIEDLISAKLDIDKFLIESGKIESKLSLEDYMTNYAAPNMIYLDHGNNIPFKVLNYDNEHTYIFFTDDINDKLIEILKNIQYDISKLTKVNIETLLENNETIENVELILDDNIYYKIN